MREREGTWGHACAIVYISWFIWACASFSFKGSVKLGSRLVTDPPAQRSLFG
jgi:hypothetical protein